MKATAGHTLSHYRLIEKIGEGGMGVVWKAEDTRLRRHVALKILPDELVGNEERRLRFFREARIAAAVKHPNIAHVYEIDEAAGVVFITMELVEGMTLRKRMAGRPLPMADTLRIATGMAEALAQAHRAHVIHRDLKPDNVMIDADGHLKLLDFGLAKLHEKHEESQRLELSRMNTASEEMTREGKILGTPSYMSPEQARGLKVDHRSDVFAFGTTIYELATGIPPFRGRTTTDTLSAIIRDDPIPPSQVNPGIPPEFDRIITRCLRKDPAERYQQTDQLAADLRHIARTTDSGEPHPESSSGPASAQGSSPHRGVRIAVLGSLAVLAIAVGIAFLGRTPEHRDLRITRTLKLTGAPSLEDFPSWSPDGTRIAYTSDESGQMDIWVHQVAGDRRVNLTEDYEGYDGRPAWSPDGEWIAFASAREGGGLFVMSSLGGPPRRLVSLALAPHFDYLGSLPSLCWSPLGDALAYAFDGTLSILPLAGKEGGPRELPARRAGVFAAEPAWSPDGRFIAYSELTGSGVTRASIALVSVDGRLHRPISDGHSFDHSPIWSSDGGRLFFVSDRSGGLDIWSAPVDDNGRVRSEPTSLTAGGEVGSIALSADGNKLVYSRVLNYSNIWSLPIAPDRKLTLDDATQLTAENNKIEALAVSAGGAWIAFDSDRTGNTDIWVMRTDGTDLRRVTIDPAHDWTPSFSPDGRDLAFHSLRSGNRDLYTIPVAGGAARQLTNDPADDSIAKWSPRGDLIAFTSVRTGTREIWTVPARGGEARQVTYHYGHRPVWSPDGSQLAFLGIAPEAPSKSAVYLVPAGGGDARRLSRTAVQTLHPLAWSPDGDVIYLYANDASIGAKPNYWALSPADGSVRQVTDFPAGARQPTWWLEASRERLYFVLWERVGDLWIADLTATESN